MNIFILDKDPVIAADMYCDKHISKMIVEHVQMMTVSYYTTIGVFNKNDYLNKKLEILNLFKDFPRIDDEGNPSPYKITHLNHPCTIWVRESYSNFKWLLTCTLSLCKKYTSIYGKRHLCENICDWMFKNKPNLPDKGLTKFALAMPDQYKTNDDVLSYRLFYISKMSYMKLNWSLVTPEWFINR